MSKHPRCLSCRKVSKTKFCSPECDQLFKQTNNLLAHQVEMSEKSSERDWRESARRNSVLNQHVGYTSYGF
jgi:hypothetical protein